MEKKSTIPLNLAFGQHGRRWREGVFCYPVISRRSGGISIGINLNPDKACNFDCIYCQVDRKTPPTVRKVDLAVMRDELGALLDSALDGSLFTAPPFAALGADWRVVRDIAFSGDGEPTTFPDFEEAVRIAAEAKSRRRLNGAKLVLITDACYLTRPNVAAALRLFDQHHGEIWAKLDAGTEDYYQLVNRPNYPLRHVMENITAAAIDRPIVIQSLWMKVHNEEPPRAEIEAYCDRLSEVLSAGGKLKLIQLYTIARQTTESYATMLPDSSLDAIAAQVRSRLSAPVATYYGVEQ